MKKPRIFIGSSSEAVKREIVIGVVNLIKDFSDPYDWSQTFKINDITIESLIAESKTSDFAIFLFCKDDEGVSKEVECQFPRDNVILEAGLFMGELGRERVFTLVEEGVKTPSDLLGVTLPTFEYSDNPTIRNSSIKNEIGKIRRIVESVGTRDVLLPELMLPQVDELAGLEDVIKHEYERAKSKYTWTHKYHITEERIPHLEFYSNESCIRAYVGGLANVKNCYWTTTAFSSAFWTKRNESRVMAANFSMMGNIAQNKGNARRLFILDSPLSVYIQLLKDSIASLRDKNQDGIIDDRVNELKFLKRAIERQLDSGYEVRAVYDADEYEDLPTDMGFDPRCSELALYDEHRVDVFKSGSSGELIEVSTYSHFTDNFEVFQSKSREYFENCWNKSDDIREVLERIEDALDHAVKKIDYRSSWLGFYESDLDEDDRKLKLLEIECFEERVKNHSSNLWGGVKKYLDIGTCTGRYMFAMVEGIAADGEILGIDDDSDCIDFSQSKLRKLRETGKVGDQLIQIERADFVARKIPDVLTDKKYDVITCMLGTLSHFGERRIADAEALDTAIGRMAKLLSPKGVLFISNWNKSSVNEGKMLSIYSDHNRRQLAMWTPTKNRLKEIFNKYELKITYEATIYSRLDFFQLAHSNIDSSKKSNNTNPADAKKRRG